MKYFSIFIVSLLTGLLIGFLTTNLMTAYIRGQQDVKAQIKQLLESTGQLPITIDDKSLILIPSQ